MTATPTQLKQNLTFEQFVKQLPDEDGRYELVNGEIVRILPIRLHETLAEFLSDSFKDEVKRLKLNYWVSGRFMVRTLTSNGREQGRHPDVSVINKTLWESQPFAYSAITEPLQLVVEVVSTNWEDDYIDKLDEYQRLGISEYWIVDYLALGSRDYLGNPKVPTVFVYLLDENGVYQMTAFRGNERIISRTFPELALTAEQVLDV
ncbi:Uma2 family endonuclease [Microcoleus sp. PH2017_28_MFU_U_A]|uniref:Uma2 family endonuclease n=1 Tax=Microcoleus sp. PH2017_28_MFU_U_A TaxID=2798838 RepID=UPI001DC57B10|nr:Uma2 family endonuclease [Microcoleus sp. PH2017_28_MFU_U_A]MCC3591086.1 Uma2 family endonuclease [Microcoleus sp. PH2017_28_MFU_U_A]